jgi:hypothetical protein
MEDTLTLAEAMEDLVSAEDFLDYFEVPYVPSVVHVNRLHILQRFHDYRDAPGRWRGGRRRPGRARRGWRSRPHLKRHPLPGVHPLARRGLVDLP